MRASATGGLLPAVVLESYQQAGAAGQLLQRCRKAVIGIEQHRAGVLSQLLDQQALERHHVGKADLILGDAAALGDQLRNLVALVDRDHVEMTRWRRHAAQAAHFSEIKFVRHNRSTPPCGVRPGGSGAMGVGVACGVRYPAVLLTHGANDPRVEVWNSTKTAARLMAASSSGKPILLRLDYDSGHGIGDTKSQRLDERADTFAFALWQMGVKGYSPKGE